MKAFELGELLAQRKATGRSYLEFLRVPSLSTGLYGLPAAGVDGQQPHTEDEVYYVISGQATIQVGEEHRAIGPGATIFVEAGVQHHFHTITEDLTLLVFFAPAEYSQSEPTS